jgi:hypothetical protein
MLKNKHSRFVLALSLVCATSAFAQNGSTRADASQPVDARCRKDVKDYLETLKFVRQTAGEQIGMQVARGYLSEEQLNQRVSTEGPCSASQLLRQKGAIR